MKKVLTTLAIAGLALGTLGACEEKKPVDQAKDATKKAAEATKDATKAAGDAAKDVKDAVKPAH
ncbi:MAG: hypothetical protein QM783_14550 [Phycisphaerales bacterium]